MENSSEKPDKSACARALAYIKETVHDAFYKPVSEDDSHVSRKRNEKPVPNGTHPSLENRNHALNLGKIPESVTAVRGRIRAVFELKPNRPAYTPEVIEASLAYMIKHLKPGEKLQVVVFQCMSEIFNGPKDVENHLSTEREIELIYRIAAEKFNLYGSALEVTDLEKLPQHEDLFTTLRSSVDEKTGIVDPEKAFRTAEKPALSDPPSSLEIVRMLYLATLEDDTFRNAIFKGIGAKLKKNGEEVSEHSAYYSMTEIAIRLSEIINGRNIHAGISRQHVYDDVIQYILKGKKGTYRNIKALHPLFEKFEGLDFETIHINNRDNPVTQKNRRSNAFRRLAAVGAASAAVSLGLASVPYGYVQYRENRQREEAEQAVTEKLRKELDGVSIAVDMSMKGTPTEKNAENLNHYATEMMEEIHTRYDIPKSLDDEIKSLLIEALVREKSNLGRIFYYHMTRTSFIDRFIMDRELYLVSRGVKAGRPYGKLMQYYDLMEDALKNKEEISMKKDELFYEPSKCGPQGMCRRDIKVLGQFAPTQAWGTYELAIHEDNAKTRLLGRCLINDAPPNLANPAFTSEGARRAVKDFIRMQKVFDSLQLESYQSEIHNLLSNETDYDGQDEFNFDDAKTSGPEPGDIIYKDFRGDFEYHIRLQPHGMTKDRVFVKIFLAKKPGESQYTIGRAIEVAKHYLTVRESEFGYGDRARSGM